MLAPKQLTLSTQIPTIARGQVRAIVKAHPAWPAFLTEKNIISADARNVDLIELALRHPGLKAQIEQILGIAPKQMSPAVLEELRRSVKVRNLIEDIERELRRVKTTAPKKARKRRTTRCPSIATGSPC